MTNRVSKLTFTSFSAYSSKCKSTPRDQIRKQWNLSIIFLWRSMSHPHESFPWVMSHSCSNMTTTMLYLYHTWLSPTNYNRLFIFCIFSEKIRLLIGRPIRLIIPSRSTKRANRVASRKNKRKKMENRIFWVDCEMTGLDYMGKGNL